MPKATMVDVSALPKSLQAQVLKATAVSVKPKAVAVSVSSADQSKVKAHLLRYRKVALVVNERNGKITFLSPNHSGWNALVGGKGASAKAEKAAKPRRSPRRQRAAKPAPASTAPVAASAAPVPAAR